MCIGQQTELTLEIIRLADLIRLMFEKYSYAALSDHTSFSHFSPKKNNKDERLLQICLRFSPLIGQIKLYI